MIALRGQLPPAAVLLFRFQLLDALGVSLLLCPEFVQRGAQTLAEVEGKLDVATEIDTLRPFQHLHLIPSADAVGVDGTRGFNVHTIAIQVPKRRLTKDGKLPSDVDNPKSVIGVWASASRRAAPRLLPVDRGDPELPVLLGQGDP